jgi:adenylate cyclase
MKSKFGTKLISGAGLGALAALIVYLLSEFILPKLFYSFEARTYDNRVVRSIQDVKSQSIDDIVIIDIDGRSESELGRFQQWPREYYSKMIAYLAESGAAMIGVDIIVVKDLRDPAADQELVRTVKNAGNVFNALYFEREDSISWRYKMTSVPEEFEWQRFAEVLPENVSRHFVNEDRIGNEFYSLLNSGYSLGHVNFRAEVDGVVRKIHLYSNFLDHSYPSLAFNMFKSLTQTDSIIFDLGENVRLFSDGNLVREIPVDDDGNMIINWQGNFQTYRYISFYDVLKKRVPGEYFKNKIILIGTSLPGLFDLRSTPFNPVFPGVEIHANILYTLLSGDFVTKMSPMETFIFLLALGVIIGIIIAFLSPIWSVIIIFLVGFVHVVTAYLWYWESQFWIPIVDPVLTLVATFTLIYLYRYNTEEKGKRFIKQTFSHFVTQSVVDELLDNPDKIKLGGEKKECTVFFSDVKGFTTISEQLTPEALVRLLNEYLTEMTNIVFKHDGMLDKYEGDAIMAVFGAPISHGNHALKACATAIEMQQQLVKLRDLWSKQGRPQIFARCGLNSGPMVVGNMGSETRFDYTVMGDAVNLGARLESANKQYGTSIMIGENTYQETKEGIIVRELDLLRVKGKTEPVKVYELVGLTEIGIPAKKQQIIDIFAQGFKYYLGQEWESALKYFKRAQTIDSKDGPSLTYIKRCERFIQTPPPHDWDGVFTMQTK